MFTLDPESHELLGTIPSGLFLGVIDVKAGIIRLFQAAPTSDPSLRQFAGHLELLRHNVIRPGIHLGFSVEIGSAQIHVFYRASILNRDFDDFAISSDMMLEVMRTLNLPQSAAFRSYP